MAKIEAVTVEYWVPPDGGTTSCATGSVATGNLLANAETTL
jgi:hypothetical protein